MPELPEVETVRRDLEREIAGKTITSVRVDGVRTVRRHDSALLVNELPGQRVEQVSRLGKFLIVRLDSPESDSVELDSVELGRAGGDDRRSDDRRSDDALVMHLRMSGQLLWTPDPTEPLRPHTHARIGFDSGEELRFVDPRTFGELWLTTSDLPELSHIGPDAYDDLPDVQALRTRFVGRRSGLKALLLNQQVIAGVGNLYADEILWLSKLRYDRVPDSLSKQEWQRFFDAIRSVLEQAIELRGSSLSDQQYLDLYGRSGHDQHEHRVYGREHEPCPRCGHPIERSKVVGRSAFWCRRCQR